MTNTQQMEAAYAAIRALSTAAEGGDVDALTCLGHLKRELAEQTQFAVSAMRDAEPPTPWSTIGRALDSSKQAVQQRYGA